MTLRRDRLHDLLDIGTQGRLTSVVAGAGFGKTALLLSWSEERNTTWHTLTAADRSLSSFTKAIVGALRLRVPGLPTDVLLPLEGAQGPDADTDEDHRADAYAAALSDALSDQLSRPLTLVLDDVQHLSPDSGSARLIAGLCRQAPDQLRLVLATRADIPFRIERMRGRGDVFEIEADALRFTVDETAELLPADLAALATKVHEATAGWPVGTRFTIEAVRDSSPQEALAAIDGMQQPEGPLFPYIAEEVFEQERDDIVDLLRTVAPLTRFTPELVTVLTGPHGRDLLQVASTRGLYLQPREAGEGWWSLTPLARQFVTERMALTDDELHRIHSQSADFFLEIGARGEALESVCALGDVGAIVSLLVAEGQAMIAAAQVEAVLEAISQVPQNERRPIIDRLEGEARQIQGDWDGALEVYARLMPPEGDVDPGLAWRIGLIHHLRGSLDSALEVYQRGGLEDGDARERALLCGWMASAHWLRGEMDDCRRLADRAMAEARAADDEQALALTHTVLAMIAAIDGDRRSNEWHYLEALQHAERAHDVLQIIRIHVNRASLHHEEASYRESLDELAVALDLADLAGFATFRSLALVNRGEAHLGLGRLEEAKADFEEARNAYDRIGASDVGYALLGLGNVYSLRGDKALARAAFEEVLAAVEDSGDLQARVPALAGLARVMIDEDLAAAEGYAKEAVAAGPVLGHVDALTVAAEVALAGDTPTEALRLAREAAAVARSRRDRAGIANALILEARVTESSDPAREAGRIFGEIGNELGVALARMAEFDLGALTPFEAAGLASELSRLGARSLAAEVEARLPNKEQTSEIAIQCLGGFSVRIEGVPVSSSQWQSRKARDLLKLLAARRGKPTHRDQLAAAVWPDDPVEKTANRLSVALSTVRGVLDPDKERPADWYITADRSSVALNPDHVTVDYEEFIRTAEHGLERWRNRKPEEARSHLKAAEAAYVGDFLEEDAYEEWCGPVREEARALYLAVAKALAADAMDLADHDAAIKYLLRVLEKDGFDEGAHLGLVEAMVAAGRHGEARRLYRHYVSKMDEIDIEAAPYPG
ncbi:MAG: tetratricopeptide repeat protein [Acidimicrobiia bacterium]|nr:tetratricopeptide repeat protein [Acidimicrobiia bacterium]